MLKADPAPRISLLLVKGMRPSHGLLYFPLSVQTFRSERLFSKTHLLVSFFLKGSAAERCKRFATACLVDEIG